MGACVRFLYASLVILSVLLLFYATTKTVVAGAEPASSQNVDVRMASVAEENNDIQFKKTTGGIDESSLYADAAAPQPPAVDLAERSAAQPGAEFTYDGQRLGSSPAAAVSEWDAASAAAAAAAPRKRPFSLSSTVYNKKPAKTKESLPAASAMHHTPAIPSKRVGMISEFEEEAEPDRVCRGTSQGLSFSNNITQHYRQLRSNFDNCVYVEGNLEITFLNDNHDLSFLQTIKEVTGYVLIARLDRVKLELPRLRVIRGRQLFSLSSSQVGPSFRYGLFVLDNRKLLKLDLHNLVEVVRGDIGLQNNPQACFLPTIQWRDMLGSDNATIDVDFKTSVSGERPWCANKGRCHYQCKQRCWAEDLFSCQSITKLECSKQCENGRCFGFGATQCCHPQCIGGCTGPTSRDCIACRYFNNDGVCVSECPPVRIYDPNIFQWRQNAEGKVAHGVQCVADCPSGLLTDDDACVRQCPGHKRELNGTCVPCESGKCRRRVCQGSQQHGPGWQTFINAKSLSQFRNCTTINGNLVILQSTFEEYGIFDDENNNHILAKGGRPFSPEVLQPLRPEQLNILENVHEVHGYVNIEGSHPNMTSLSFLKNLRIIHGRQTLNGTALQVIKNDYLQELGLNHLERIINGGVIVYSNPNLCYTGNVSWTDIVSGSTTATSQQLPPQQRLASLLTAVTASGGDSTGNAPLSATASGGPRIMVGRNANDDVCKAQGHVCHEQCDPAGGCWGPHPEQCIRCFRYKYQDKCVDACNSADGMYFEPTNNTCMACDDECADGPAAGCIGPGPHNCLKCQNAKDGPYCVSQCPEGKYADASGYCQKCNETCANGCTGPSSFVGRGGCNSCDVALQNATSPILSTYATMLAARERMALYQSRSTAGDDNSLSPLSSSALLHNNKPGLLVLNNRNYDDLDSENEDILESSDPSYGGGVEGDPSRSMPSISMNCLPKGSPCPGGTFGQFQPFMDESSLTAAEKREPYVGLRVALAGKRVCKPCHPLCLECTEISLDCGRCRDFRQSGVCTNKCSPDYYPEKMPNEKVCSPCDDNCDGCTGPGPTRCLSCRRFRVYIDGSDGFNCTDKCPADKSVVITQQDSPNAICVDSSHPAAIQQGLAKRNTTMIIIFFVVIAMIVLIFCIFCLARQCKQRAKANRKALEFVVKLNESSPDEPLQETGAPPNTNKMEIIAENDLHRIKMIGSGAFGTVYKGEWTPAGRGGLKVKVAVKVLHDATSSNSDADKLAGGKIEPISRQHKQLSAAVSDATNKMNAQAEFIEEAYVMASMKHPNLVPLLGVCLAKEPQLVTTLMEQGCLLNYLREHQTQIGSKMMLNWAVQIAKGMLYLEQHRLVHRDLAARNVLLQSPSVCRITDFGLSKLLDVGELEYRAGGGKMPVKWMAIESLMHRIFTHKSDVWSFGVTVWEILMFGEMPYRGLLNRDIPELIAAGERLSQPQTSSLDIYTIMMRCWLPDPYQRPNFTQLVEMFSRMARDPRRFLIVEADRYLRESSSTTTTSASSPGGPLSSPAPLVPRESTGGGKDNELNNEVIDEEQLDDDDVIGGSSEMLNSPDCVWPSSMGSTRRVRTISTLARDKQHHRSSPSQRVPGGNGSFSPNKYAEMLAMQARSGSNNMPPSTTITPESYNQGSIKYAQLLLSASRMENAEKCIDSSSPQSSTYHNHHSLGRPYYIRPAIPPQQQQFAAAATDRPNHHHQVHSVQVHDYDGYPAPPVNDDVRDNNNTLHVDRYNYLLPAASLQAAPSSVRAASSSNADTTAGDHHQQYPILNSSPTTVSVPWLAISTSPYAASNGNSKFSYDDRVRQNNNSASENNTLAYTMNIANALYDGLMSGNTAVDANAPEQQRAEHHSTSTMRTSLTDSPQINMTDDDVLTSSSSPTRSSVASGGSSAAGAAVTSVAPTKRDAASFMLSRSNTAPATKNFPTPYQPYNAAAAAAAVEQQPHRGISTFVGGGSSNGTPVSARRTDSTQNFSAENNNNGDHSAVVMRHQRYQPKSSIPTALKLVNNDNNNNNSGASSSNSDNDFHVAVNPGYHNPAFDTDVVSNGSNGNVSSKTANKLGLKVNALPSVATTAPSGVDYRRRLSSERTPLDPGAQPLSPLQPALSPSVFVVGKSIFNGLHNNTSSDEDAAAKNDENNSVSSLRRASVAAGKPEARSHDAVQPRLSYRNNNNNNSSSKANGLVLRDAGIAGSLRREETAV